MEIGNITVDKLVKKRGFIETSGYSSGLKVQIPMLVASGNSNSPLLVVIANQHGREINGIEVIRRIFEELNPKKMKGTVVFIPIANPLAVRLHQQDFPSEVGRWVKNVPTINMARVWPGKANGNIIERMVYVIFNQVIKKSDCVIDLHGWSDMTIPLVMSDKRCKKLAKVFGHRIFHLRDSKRREKSHFATICSNNEIPSLTVELPPQNRLSEESIGIGLRGIKNIMCHMGMIKGEIELPEEQFYTTAETKGHILRAEHEGLFVPLKEKGELVKRGDRLGIICSLETLDVIQKINSPIDGILFNKMIMRFEACPESNIVSEGENLCMVKKIYRA